MICRNPSTTVESNPSQYELFEKISSGLCTAEILIRELLNHVEDMVCRIINGTYTTAMMPIKVRKLRRYNRMAWSSNSPRRKALRTGNDEEACIYSPTGPFPTVWVL